MQHRELRLVPGCECAIRRIKLAHLHVREGAEGTGPERTGDPPVTVRVRFEALSHFDGTESFAADHHFFDFTEPGVA